jgi:DNA-binding beta-propeller fold protein YncE
LFARSTAEGHAPLRINTGKIHGQLLITPDGKKLYAFSLAGTAGVTVLGVQDLQVKRTFDLPLPPYTAFMSKSGKHIYVSAETPAESVMVLDTGSDRVVEVIPTGVPAFGVVVTPDERKLFLALGNHGLKRIDLKTRESHILSAMAYPIHLGIDPNGRRLYVSYQGGGPVGRPGHDSVDILDDFLRLGVVANGILPAGAPRSHRNRERCPESGALDHKNRGNLMAPCAGVEV